jgi:hypothetical protein
LDLGENIKKKYSELGEVEIYNIFRQKLDQPLKYLRKNAKKGSFLFGKKPTIV